MHNLCNCEHLDHFEGKGHAHMSVPASPSWTGMYVGPVCTECGMGHMSEWLVRHGPYMEHGTFVANYLGNVKLLTVDEIRMLFGD